MTVKLDEICKLNMGQSPDSSTYNEEQNGLPFFQGNADFGEIYPKVRLWCSEPTKIANAGDILISVRAPIGALNFADCKCCIGRGLAAIQADNDKCLQKYLWYCLASKVKELNSKGTGSTFKAISKSILCETQIPLPPLEEQRKIAETLDKVSDLINKRKQQLEKLDLLIKSKFVEMFGYETENRWNCVLAEDVAQICVGVVIKPSQYYTDINGIPAFRSLNIGYMTVKNTDWVYFTKEGYNKNTKSIIKENDVLVIRSGAPGTACVATKEFDGYNAIDIIIAHPNLEKVNPFYLAMFTNMPHGMNQIKGKIGGAAQQHFNVGAYKELLLMLPPIELQNQFADFVKQTEKTKTIINQSLEKLETLKKALMQEYFG